MSGGNSIRAIGANEPEAGADIGAEQVAPLMDDAEQAWTDESWDADDAPARPARQWIAPTLAFLALAGWSAFFGWAFRTELLSLPTAQRGIEFLAQWAVPALLIASAWLITMRSSNREAQRFGAIAQSLREESSTLEHRLSAANRELSLAREFLAAQSRELESVGRMAGERLSAHADHLSKLVLFNREQLDSIAQVSTTAMENMGRLRDDLPVIANSARDVANQIGGAGRTAHGQIADLVSGFERLNQFGQASERQVGALQSRVDAALAAFEAQTSQMGDLTAARFDALRGESEAFRAELDGREVETLAALRRRIELLDQEVATTRDRMDSAEEDALASMRARLASLQSEAHNLSNSLRENEDQAAATWSDKIDQLAVRLRAAIDEITAIDEAALASANRKLEALSQEAESVDRHIAERDGRLLARIIERQDAFNKSENEAFASLENRLAALDENLASRRAAILDQNAAIDAQAASLMSQLQGLQTHLQSIAATGEDAETKIGTSVNALMLNLEQSRSALAGTDAAVAELTDASVRLLELIQASAQHSRTDLPAALVETEVKLGHLADSAGVLAKGIGASAARAEDLSAYVLAARNETEGVLSDVERAQAEMAENTRANLSRITAIKSGLTEAGSQADELATGAMEALRGAIVMLESNAHGAIASIDGASAEAVRGLAERLTAMSQQAIEQALQQGAAGALTGLEAAASRATGASREATVQLRDQLSRVNELASNLESRVARARDLAEQQVDRDFARRVALISEGLNSTAIDIEKVLSTDVSDSAWTAYLRGDRGIFTRRAVRLLDNTQARDIAELYDADPDFRENVSRYIADFENMLRTLLSTRDGKAVSVTLLSSDMGKLYVALAQAIERLRA